MNLSTSLFPVLPQPLLDTIVIILAGLGSILLVYGVLLEAERRQDAVFVIGALCLLIYAIWINNLIFMLAMGGFALVSLVEMIEIVAGVHKHSDKEVDKYKNPQQ